MEGKLCKGEEDREIKTQRASALLGQQNDRHREMEWTGVKAINLQAW